MNMLRNRADNSAVGRWFWTVDRWTVLAIGTLICFGYVMMLAASPAVAERIGQSRDIFILKQVVFLAAAGILTLAVSMLDLRGVRRLALAGCAIALLMTMATMVIGVEIKGARRWIALPGMSLQPSEFLKPCFAVTAAWLISEQRRLPGFPGWLVAVSLFLLIGLLLKMQPDIGMLGVIVIVFFIQVFIAGVNLFIVGVLGGLGAATGVAAYFVFNHVRERVDRFLAPGGSDHYQVIRAKQAFGSGGLLGRGPGEGRVKDVLPDAHADFVFAVTGEEFGLIVCAVIVGLFAFIVLRCLLRLLKEQDLFVILAASGLVAGFGLQAFINMGSTMALIPTKGMTLPFISYGGSSALAIALGMGMLLALTRRRHGMGADGGNS
jgi:cell division protein FtsW